MQKQVNFNWIAKTYEDELRMKPTWPTEAFRHKVVNNLKYEISSIMIIGQ